jgi:hypothetical protein
VRVVPANVEVRLDAGADGDAQLRSLPDRLRAAAARGSAVVVLPRGGVSDGAAAAVAAAPGTAVALGDHDPDGGGTAVVVAGGMVVGSRPPGAAPEGGERVARGALRVVPADAGRVAEQLERVLATAGALDLARATDVVTFAAVRSGAAVAAVDPGPDEPAARLRWSSRGDDGFASTFLVRPLSRRVTAVALRLGTAPAPITAVALLLGLGAAACFAVGVRGWLVAGAVLLVASLVVDCVDGEVARYSRRTSTLGAYADVMADRVKEIAVYAGLAAGAARSGHEVWGLAALALAVQLVRHQTDYSFWVGQRRVLVPPPEPVDPTWPGPLPPGGPAPGGGVAALSARTSGLTWAKRVLVLPVAERLLLIAVLAGAGWPAAALAVLVGWGAVALVYMAAGRVGRALAWPRRVGDDPVARRGWELLADAGLLLRPVRPLGRPGGPAGWAVAPALLAAALAIVLGAAALVPATWPAAYAVVGAVALRGYDLASRERLLGTGRSALAPWALGVEGRPVVAVLACGVAGPAWREWVLGMLAAWVVVATLVESGDAWRGRTGGVS